MLSQCSKHNIYKLIIQNSFIAAYNRFQSLFKISSQNRLSQNTIVW